MIVVDMDMPKNCQECLTNNMFVKCPFDYMAYVTKRNPICPIKCDLEDIDTLEKVHEIARKNYLCGKRDALTEVRTEIYNLHPIKRGNNDYANGAYDGQCWIIDKALSIIDNHIKGASE